jgi:hypothetical protein
MNINKISQKIRYLTNESGEKTDVLVPLEIWQNILNFLPKNEIEDSKELILNDLKQALLDGKEGKTFPIEELWEGMDD